MGSGPIGGFLSTKISNATLIDQKKTIGTPTKCTGILTKEIKEFLSEKELKKITLNKIGSTTIYGPRTNVKLNIGTNYIISNKLFEQLLIDKAEKNGTKILLEHKYLGSEGRTHHIRNLKTKNKKIIKSGNLIGSDGPQSQVNKEFNIQQNKKKYLGYQVRLKVKEHENTIQFFPNIGIYAWYVPESDTIARVGVCAEKNPKQILEAFLKRFKGKKIEIQGGFIPYYKPFQKTTFKNNKLRVSLLGDAANHIKNTTGGGIIPGLKAANKYGQSTKRYCQTPIRLRQELYSHFMVHNVLKQCKPKEWDQLIGTIKNNSEDFEKNHRDQLWKLLPKLLKNPRIIQIGLKKIGKGLFDKEKNILF